MLFSTPSHFLVLGLLAFGFWLVGFATHPGGRKWREMYEQEADDFSSYRTDSDDKVRAATRRVTELERETAGFERERAESAAAIADLEASLERERTESAAAIADLEDRLHAARTPAPPPVAPAAPAPFTPTFVAPEPVVAPVAAAPFYTTPVSGPAPVEAAEPTPAETIDAPEAPVAEAIEHPVDEPVAAEPPLADASEPESVEAEALVAETPEPEPIEETVAETPAEVVDERPSETRAIEPPAAEIAAAAPLPIGAPTPTPAFAPAVPDESKKAWFGAAGYNDLTQIRGIDGVLSTRLFGLGVTRFADLEKLSAVDEMALEQRLNVPVGFIAREQWREQAALLRAGNFAEHSNRFGAPIHV
ncbi:MAG: hypothetical protein WC729_17820 [Sphingomonas sp.]|jgi:predicted flap endonuclease-1-like 5' DNA nuclease|uniref:hypothetical protein n=1 Tax=Sphingomonas sp. TaxID=28214 RepID=UPI003569D9BC